jgi:hypothetical protein
MPTMLIIFSDMEFDDANTPHFRDTTLSEWNPTAQRNDFCQMLDMSFQNSVMEFKCQKSKKIHQLNMMRVGTVLVSIFHQHC